MLGGGGWSVGWGMINMMIECWVEEINMMMGCGSGEINIMMECGLGYIHYQPT